MIRAGWIATLFLAAGLGAGAAAGLFVKRSVGAQGMADAASDLRDRQQGSGAPAEREFGEYARLNNQFIVPVVRSADVEALVVLSLTLEVKPGASETVFRNEPRIRDRFLRVLFDHANSGGFETGFTQTDKLARLRRGLLESARTMLGAAVRDVLIQDIVRQDI